MRSTSIRALALSTAAGLMAFGATVIMPGTASAASAERAAIGSTTDANQPVEMQRRGGWRGGPRFAGRPGPYRGPYRGRGWGPGAAVGVGAAALIIGGAAAAAAASNNGYYRECWTERRWVDTYYGPEVRRVRVCN